MQALAGRKVSFPTNKPKFFLAFHSLYVPFAAHSLLFCGATLGIDKRHGTTRARIPGSRHASPIVRRHTLWQVRGPTGVQRPVRTQRNVREKTIHHIAQALAHCEQLIKLHIEALHAARRGPMTPRQNLIWLISEHPAHIRQPRGSRRQGQGERAVGQCAKFQVHKQHAI